MGSSSSEDTNSKKRSKSKKSSKKSHRKSKSDDRSASVSSSSSDSSSTQRRKRKEKKARKKSKKEKRSRKKSIDVPGDSSANGHGTSEQSASGIADRLRLLAEPMQGPDVALAAVNEVVKPKGPMTKEQWDKHQKTLRRVHDPETGRTRLIRGDGEIMEEIVTKDMHIAINKAATKADGAYFETVLGLKKHK